MTGSWVAMKKGAGFVRILFLLLTTVLIGKLAWDMVQPWLHGWLNEKDHADRVVFCLVAR
jgi:hypothetical protein